jgi:capsid assembly protease
MTIHRIAQHAGRPLLMTESAARELALRALQMDAGAYRHERLARRPAAFLKRLGVGSFLKPRAMEDDDDAGPLPPPRPIGYAPAYASEPEHEGFGWSLCEGIACFEIEGALMDRGFSSISGATFWGYDCIGEALREAYADARVRGIFVRWNSPGGVVAGTLEALTADIRAMRETENDDGKPIWAYADMAASAAYWTASQFDRIYAPAVGMVGSIGAVIVHADWSKALEQDGLVITAIQFGAKKTDGAWWKPLSEEARADLQAEIDAIGERFIGDILAGRGFLSRAGLLGTEAACFMADHPEPARAGLKLGLVDEIAREADAFRALVEHTRNRALIYSTPPISASGAAPAPPPAAPSQPGAQSVEQSMRTKKARIDAVMARTAMSSDEKLKKIEEIMSEEDGDEEGEESEGDDENTDDTETENEAGAEGEENDAGDDDEEEEAPAASASVQLKDAKRIAGSKEAQANPKFALSAIANGVAFQAFKAMAPAAGKSSGFASRMEDQPGAQRLGNDARPEAKGGDRKVVKLKPAADYYAAAQGTKKSG